MNNIEILKFIPVQKITIDLEDVGQRLDNYLIRILKGLPRTRIYSMVRTGELRINKGRVKPLYKLQLGDIIRIPPLHLQPKVPIDCSKIHRFKILECILYEDEQIIILNKPAGLAVHGGSGLSFGLIEAMRLARPELKSLELVHRLDKDTSGCIMLAKKRSLLKYLHQCFINTSIKKNYSLLIKGAWSGPNSIDVSLTKNILISGERMVKVDLEGQSSKTHFRVLKKFRHASLVEAHPISGRTHQIRVHAKHAGHPILGDPKYGQEDANLEFKKKGLKRMFLHASQLTIPLPYLTKPLQVKAELELSLQKLLILLEQE